MAIYRAVPTHPHPHARPPSHPHPYPYRHPQHIHTSSASTQPGHPHPQHTYPQSGTHPPTRAHSHTHTPEAASCWRQTQVVAPRPHRNTMRLSSTGCSPRDGTCTGQTPSTAGAPWHAHKRKPTQRRWFVELSPWITGVSIVDNGVTAS